MLEKPSRRVPSCGRTVDRRSLRGSIGYRQPAGAARPQAQWSVACTTWRDHDVRGPEQCDQIGHEMAVQRSVDAQNRALWKTSCTGSNRAPMLPLLPDAGFRHRGRGTSPDLVAHGLFPTVHVIA